MWQLPPGVKHHLHANEDQNRAQAVTQVAKQIHHAGQQEIERPQTHDREYVRREHNERYLGDPEDRRHAVDREDHIGALDHQQYEEQRRNEEFAALADKELVAMGPISHAQVLASEAKHNILIGIGIDTVGAGQFDARVNQEQTKRLEHELDVDELIGGQDEAQPHHDRAKNAPEQD